MRDEDRPLSACAAARAIAEGTLRSEALVSECLARIATREPALHAWAHVDPGLALQNARACDLQPGAGVLRGIPGGKGRLAERLRRQGKRLPLWLPSRGDYLEHKFQFVHIDDVARLIAHILQRKLADPKLTVLNIAGRGDPLELRRCIDIAKIEVQRVPARSHSTRQASPTTPPSATATKPVGMPRGRARA